VLELVNMRCVLGAESREVLCWLQLGRVAHRDRVHRHRHSMQRFLQCAASRCPGMVSFFSAESANQLRFLLTYLLVVWAISRGDFYCATRHWMSSTSSTDSYDKPYATSYFCRHGAFAQVTATYFPDKYQEWNLETTVAPGSFPEQTAPASSADLAVTTAGGPGANSSNTNGNGNSSTPSSEVSPPLPTGAIAGIAVAGAVGLFATVLLILFWRRRKRSTTTATVQLVETSRPIESQDQDRSLLTSAATPSATHVYPVEKEAVSLTAASAMQTPGYPHSSETHLVDGNTAAENADTVGGLPELDDMRRLRPGAYMGGHRGAPSVMTDMSETLTLGGDGEVDDIHAIGHGGR